MISEAKKRADAKYDAGHTRQIKLKLNLKNDKDILKRLDEVGNKQGYIKKLIRHEIDSESKLIWLIECMKKHGIDVSYEVTKDDGISMIEVHWD